ncbi:hypothetical protein NM688_g8766 [Phlebia brevispora]|uniref:Uncharacterized protein n=1 Tax=Phlebia brevispora TaxID=194682 RepID=A0ACC1RRR4_9APHY|nr:hypothetical protein NM688_g8766 [Phlebia brevispora]
MEASALIVITGVRCTPRKSVQKFIYSWWIRPEVATTDPLYAMMLSLLLLLVQCAFACAFPEPLPVTGNVTVHDPTICKDYNGTYWVFSTGTGIDIRSSPDRIHWTYEGAVFPDGSPWADGYAVDNFLWAPDCTYINGEFWLYYAASTSGSTESAIFLAKSSTGAPGSWSNVGLVIATVANDTFNAIDPNLFIDTNGDWYLSFGSFFSGIKLLDRSTGNWTGSPIIPVAERAPGGTNAIEGSGMYKSYDNYYLFSSWDACCIGIKDTYNVRVGRSSNVTGPYKDQNGTNLTDGGGTLVLGNHDHVIGPGGEDLFTDIDGPIMIYHYFNSSINQNCTSDFGNCSFAVQLGINRVNFSTGWPVLV